MRPGAGAAQRGFTFIEAAVVVAIMGIVLAVGMPSMSNWLLARKAVAAAVFYQEGFTLARNTAIAHNSHSRLVLVDNTANGKMDWRVDICFPGVSTPCDDENGAWSTLSTAAGGDPDPDTAHRFVSVGRDATAMPGADALALTVGPSGVTEVYFTPLGWVDANVAPHVKSIGLAPAAARNNAFAPMSVVLTLAGLAVVCDPALGAGDARGCPP